MQFLIVASEFESYIRRESIIQKENSCLEDPHEAFYSDALNPDVVISMILADKTVQTEFSGLRG